MGKLHDKWSFETYLRYLREGRGQGEGLDYLPWLTTHTVPSNGIVYRVVGEKTGRIHHLLSNHEYRFFLLLDHDDNVLDIREQFPLTLKDTMRISEKLGIRHPVINGFPYVLTCDFLITTKNGLLARTVKMTQDLKKERVIEKFNIEATLWRELEIDWKIVTEKEINIIKADNLEWLYNGASARELIHDDTVLRRSKTAFLQLYSRPDISFWSCIDIIEESFGLTSGTGIALFKSLVREKSISLDLNSKINFTDPRKSFQSSWL